MAEELIICAKTVSVFETRGLVFGELSRLTGSIGGASLKGTEYPSDKHGKSLHRSVMFLVKLGLGLLF